MAQKSTGSQSEAGFHQQEIKFQYEDEEPMPFILESYMFDMPVEEVKRGLLHLELLQHIKDKPEDLRMYLLLPATQGSGDGDLIEMDERRNMNDYKDDLSQCLKLRLLKIDRPLFVARN